MYRKLLGNAALGMIACSGLAKAGDVRLGQDGSVNLLAKAGTSLTCSDVNCTDVARRSFAFSSLFNTSSPAATTAAMVNQVFATVLTPARGLGGTSTVATWNNPTPAAASTGADPSTASSDPTFILSNGKVIERFESGWADVTTGDYTGGSGNVYTSSGINAPATSYQSQFSDPIVSPAFNLSSTSIVVNVPASQPAFSNALPKAPDAASVVTPFSGQATIVVDSPVQVENSPDVIDPTRSVDAAGGGFTSMASATANMSTPEPGTDLLIGGGLIAAGIFARVKRSKSRQ